MILSKAKGQVLVLVAVLLAMVLAMAALVVDFGRAYGVKARLNAAVDAASFEATRALSQGNGEGNDDEEKMRQQALDAATAYFKANYPDGHLGANPIGDISVDLVHTGSTGLWSVSVEAAARMNTPFAAALNLIPDGNGGKKAFDWSSLVIRARAQSQRKPVDMVLSMDCSASMQDVFPTVKASAQDYVSLFSRHDDRVGLVAFSTGAGQLVPICRDASCNRGFNKNAITKGIGDLQVVYSTNSEEGLKQALDMLNSVPQDGRSMTRAIVFFSDGAPNTFNGRFKLSNGLTVDGNLFSEYDGGKPHSVFNPHVWNDNDTVAAERPNIAMPMDAAPLDTTGQVLTSTDPAIPSLLQTPRRTLSGGTTAEDLHCDVNKASRNMAENMATEARRQGIYVFSLGLGALLKDIEVKRCGYTTAQDSGEVVLKRLANTTDSDTYDGNQPTGLYCYAATTDQLKPCFDQIASAILRITQ